MANSQETQTEYRVVWKGSLRDPPLLMDLLVGCTLAQAIETLAEYRKNQAMPDAYQLQQRTVTYTPWIEV